MYYLGFFSLKRKSEPFLSSLFSAVCLMRGHEIRSASEPVLSRSYVERECLTQRERRQKYHYFLFYTKLQIFLMKLISCSWVINLVTDIDDRLYQMLLCDENAEFQARFVAKKQLGKKMLLKLDASLLPG